MADTISAPAATPPRDPTVTNSASSAAAAGGSASSLSTAAPAREPATQGRARKDEDVVHVADVETQEEEEDVSDGEGLAYVKLDTEGPPIALEVDAATGKCSWTKCGGDNKQLDIQEMSADEYLRRVQFEASRTELRS